MGDVVAGIAVLKWERSGWHMVDVALCIVAGIVGGIVVCVVAGEYDCIGNDEVNEVGISNQSLTL